MVYPSIVMNRNGLDYITDSISNDFYEGVIYMFCEIDSTYAENFISMMHEIKRKGIKKIKIYINSPGGDVSSGFAIYDCLKSAIKDGIEINMVATGMCASMAAFLLATVNPGKRFATANATIMLHQPLGGLNGFAQASDIYIKSQYINDQKDKINRLLANATGQTYKAIEKTTDRDAYFSPSEACEFGIIDQIV